MRVNDHYILNDKGEVAKTRDLETWARWIEESARNGKRVVGRTKVGAATVSTVFLGLDHRFAGGGTPILWETMVFGGKLDHRQERCAGTREQAEAMHERILALTEEAEGVARES